MTELDLEMLDLSRLSKDEGLLDWVVIYSRLITDGDFEKHKSILKKLALKGQLKALALYLANEKFENRDEMLVEMAKNIEKNINIGKKTPEEWNVVANLHLSDPVEVLLPDFKIQNVKQLLDATHLALIRFDEIRNQYDHGRYYDCFQNKWYTKREFFEVISNYLDRWFWLDQCLKNQNSKFSEAVKKAQLGYYGRYFKHREILDACSFLDIYKESFNRFFEYKIAKSLSNGKEYSPWQIGKIMRKDFRKSKDEISVFAILIGKQSVDGMSNLDKENYSHRGRKFLESVAGKQLSWEKQNINFKINQHEKG